MDEERLRQNLEAVHHRIAAATRRAGRRPEDVTLVAVTKRVDPETTRRLIALGVRDLGENYPQELWRKSAALAGFPVRWHLIGHLQTNKAKKTLPLVRMIHGVDSLRLLRLLDELAAGIAEPPAVCLQVNASGETSKHGWSPEGLLAEAGAIAACRSIPIVGLMTMAALETPAEAARPTFATLRRLRDELRSRLDRPLPELSMGMSNDFEVAIEEGATLVRIGSALFEGVTR
ncbi:MAG: YggS family pyridoxal phosphate-dependent enzyme [Isosphaeraceae bacterium]|nr:YggS family pyridoxal phosphate-dependent enzyme [Isosphaeraceae bacterium]